MLKQLFILSNTTKNDTPKNTPEFTFKLPIDYLDETKTYSLNANVINDLELDETPNSNTCMYNILFEPKHLFAKNMIQKWKRKYTTDIRFLKDTQSVIAESTMYLEQMENHKYNMNCETINEIWKNVKEDGNFLEKHSFMEWDFMKDLNNSSSFLQCVSIINIMSPLMSLFVPVVFLIMPFIILKIQQVPISFELYMDILKSIAKNHFIGKALNIDAFTIDKIIYIMVIAAFYMLQIYQNITSCIHFYKNMKKMNENLHEIKNYLEYSIDSMDCFVSLHKKKETYVGFCNETEKHSMNLKLFLEELNGIQPFSNDYSKLFELGYMLRCYYHFYSNPYYENALKYSFDFEGYTNNILGLFENIRNKHIEIADFDETKESVLEKQYYPPHKNGQHVKNTCKLDKNMIITAPNASGKTTILKMTAINIIFTQQIGCGFYKNCRLNPYTHIHSYLNIPDTSGRDSLFQAESRRCKEIIDLIHENPIENKCRHFCIFDELYSGTNPTEATKSAYAFLSYLSKFENVDFILTTHYVSICNKFKKSTRVRNHKMKVETLEDGKLKYTYKLVPGISRIQGAVKILKEMNYPCEIIDNIESQ
jgi:hypothetical protein